MSDHIYDVATDTANGRVNLQVLVRELLEAGLASGGTFEGIVVAGGVVHDSLEGVITGGIMTISWENTLSGPDLATQDGIVAAHAGDGFAVTDPVAVESLGVSSTGSAMTKLSLTPAGPLAEGLYELSASAEIRLAGIVAGAVAQISVVEDAAPLISSANPLDVFEAFSFQAIRSYQAGQIPVLSIDVDVVGLPATLEVQMARLSLRFVG